MTIDDLMDQAIRAARQSPNRPRKVGAVLVTADGRKIAACNTFPKGVRDIGSRHIGDERLLWMEHAERNAILEAARRGIATEGASITSTFFPCADCARAIVVSGIVTLNTVAPDLDDPVWGEHFVRSRVILEEGGVRTHFLPRELAAMHAETMRRPD